MYEEIFEKIKTAPVITIFRHQQPDMDALGSQMGLAKALRHLFPDKEIYAVGEQTRDGFVMDIVDDDKIQESLAVLLDTSTADRVDDARFFQAADSVRLDHHIQTEEIAKLEKIDEKAGATAEMLVQLLKEQGAEIGAEAAQDLYQALSADTARYTTSSTRPESLEAGAWLLRQGASVVRTDTVNNGISLQDFRYGALIRRKASVQNRLLFAVMSKTDWMTCGLDVDNAAKKAFMLSGVRDVDIWALFTEADDGTFFASLRSRTREVRDIAAQYGGGGHISAAGIKGLTGKQVVEVIKKLSARSVETEEQRQAREEAARAEEEAAHEKEAAAEEGDAVPETQEANASDKE